VVGSARPHGMPFGPSFPFPPVSDSHSHSQSHWLKGPEQALTAALSVLKMEINRTHGGEGLMGPRVKRAQGVRHINSA